MLLAPHPAQKLLARPGMASMGEEEFQQLVFGRRQFHFPVVPENAARGPVHAKRTRCEVFGGFFGGRFHAPQVGFNSRHQLARAERLRDVVVAAQFQTQHAIDFIGARGEKDYGNSRHLRMTPDAPADFETILTRQHHVEHDQVGVPALQFFQSTGAATQNTGLKARPREVVLNQCRQFGFIFNDGDFLWHGNSLSLSAALAARRARAYRAQMTVGINSRGVPVIPDDAQGVTSHWFDRFHPQSRLEHRKWTGARAIIYGRSLLPGRGAMRPGATGAGAPVAQILHVEGAVVAVFPVDFNPPGPGNRNMLRIGVELRVKLRCHFLRGYACAVSCESVLCRAPRKPAASLRKACPVASCPSRLSSFRSGRRRWYGRSRFWLPGCERWRVHWPE